jgi:hypothetical protein
MYWGYVELWLMSLEQLVEWELAGGLKYVEETYPSATFSTTWPGLGSNPGCYSGKPVTNHLSYGTSSQ